MPLVPLFTVAETPNTDATQLAADVAVKLTKVFCKEMYWRQVGKNWDCLYQDDVVLLNMRWLLQYPLEEDFVDILVCYYRNHF